MPKFATLYSSSSGNSAYIENNGRVILIDCGKNCKTTINALYSQSIAVNDIDGILITHEHSDHIAGLRVLLKNYRIPVFGSPATLRQLKAEKAVPDNAILTPIPHGMPFWVGNFSVTAFEISHDSCCGYGYKVQTTDGKKLGYLTDSGCVSDAVVSYLCDCSLVAIESNYDEQLLNTGRYPAFLKRRIASKFGHLCNNDSAQAVAVFLRHGVKNIVLCHLSKENNRPEKVLATLAQTLAEHGIVTDDGYRIAVAPSDTPLQPMEY